MRNKATLFVLLIALFAFTAEIKAQCPAGQSQVNVSITLDKYGSETTWSLKGLGGSPTYLSGGPYTDNTSGTVKKDSICVPDGTALTFTINDSYGDGICCAEGNGLYTVKVGAFTVASGGSFTSTESTSFIAPPYTYDASINVLDLRQFVLLGSNDIKGTIRNNGTSTITTLNLHYSINDGQVETQNLGSLNIPAFSDYTFTHSTPWVSSAVGTHTVKVWTSDINSNSDQNTGNDTISQTVFVTDQLVSRLQLFEEFTGENCGPCAATNPGLNTLLNANEDKVVSIKYQTNHGSSAPAQLYNQTKADVDARRTFYNNSAAPDGYHDGNYYTGHPASFNQGHMNSRDLYTSPFIVETTHSLSNDTIYVSTKIKATVPVSGTLKAHIAVIERNIYFDTPLGSNGEKHFEGVMRKLLPTSGGTTLPASYSIGDSTVINTSWKLQNIYDYNEIAVVAFVQDNSTREVHQAGYSESQPLLVDAGVTAVTSVPVVQCEDSITPSVTIKNFGVDVLNSLTISYKIDNATAQTFDWNGTLAAQGTAVVVLPTLFAANGSHTLTITTSNPNGSFDVNTNNNSKTTPFNIFKTPSSTPIVETFSSTTFPPANWANENADNGAGWTRVTGAGGFGASTSCSKMSFFTSSVGSIDNLYLPLLNLTAETNVLLSFDVAYAQYAAENDRITVEVSANCGGTWTNVWSKSGSALKTANAITTSFTPNATQWRTETVDLNAYAGTNNVMVRFKALSDYGNNAFIDNVNVGNLTGITNNLNSTTSVNVYPNPASDNSTIEITSASAQNVKLAVYNSIGELVRNIDNEYLLPGTHKISLDTSKLAEGVYLINITTGENIVIKKITIIR